MSFQKKIGLSKFDAVEINKPVMVGQAVRIVFAEELDRPTHNFEAIEVQHFGVLRALRISILADARQDGKTLNKRVQIELGVGESTARKYIVETLSLGLIKEIQDPNDNRFSLYRIETAVLQKLDRLAEIKLEVSDVVRAQIADPLNPQAGAEYLSEDIYFNVMDFASVEAAAETVREKKG